jgi:hypothetical protein
MPMPTMVFVLLPSHSFPLVPPMSGTDTLLYDATLTISERPDGVIRDRAVPAKIHRNSSQADTIF